jgi:hypothetical protein
VCPNADIEASFVSSGCSAVFLGLDEGMLNRIDLAFDAAKTVVQFRERNR